MASSLPLYFPCPKSVCTEVILYKIAFFISSAFAHKIITSGFVSLYFSISLIFSKILSRIMYGIDYLLTGDKIG